MLPKLRIIDQAFRPNSATANISARELASFRQLLRENDRHGRNHLLSNMADDLNAFTASIAAFPLARLARTFANRSDVIAVIDECQFFEVRIRAFFSIAQAQYQIEPSFEIDHFEPCPIDIDALYYVKASATTDPTDNTPISVADIERVVRLPTIFPDLMAKNAHRSIPILRHIACAGANHDHAILTLT